MIGCGAIGGTLARAIVEGDAGATDLVAICDIDADKVERLKGELPLPSLFHTTDPEELIRREDVELVIEAASQETVHAVAERALDAGKSILIMSVGALRDGDLHARLEKSAREGASRSICPPAPSAASTASRGPQWEG